MDSHLSEDQITEWVLGARDELVLRHLETCHACSAEAQQLRSSISGFRDAIHAAAQGDQSFWRHQQLAFRERVSAKDWYPLHWAWLVAMVMVLISAVFLTRTPNAPQNHSSEDADNALLKAVQGDLGREVPQALAPAVLIAQERNEILASKFNRQSVPKQ
jgi:anti-sigma factor RsiW